MAHTTLVDAQTLHRHLDDPNWVVIDCRHAPHDIEAGRREYLQGHIPGARHAHMAFDLSAKGGNGLGRHPLPAPEILARTLGEWGIGNDSQVVVYDNSGNIYSARLWWMLRWLGHGSVAVLDGGWQAWLSANLPQSTSSQSVRQTSFSGQMNPEMTVDLASLQRLRLKPEHRLIDARPPERFRGEDERQYPVAGHIPGAINRCYRQNLTESGFFKAPSLLRQEYLSIIQDAPPENVTHQCGAGVMACNNILAMEIAGLNGSKLYPGSWSQWCTTVGMPIASPAVLPNNRAHL